MALLDAFGLGAFADVLHRAHDRNRIVLVIQDQVTLAFKGAAALWVLDAKAQGLGF